MSLGDGAGAGLPTGDIVFEQEGFGAIEFEADGNVHWGQFLDISGSRNPNWKIGLALPRSDVIAQVERNNRINMLVGLLSVTLAALFAAFVSKNISRPLPALAQETVRIGPFNLSPVSWRHSIVEEVDRLTQTIEEMKLSLRSFQKYGSAILVRGLMQRGEEAQFGGKRLILTIYFGDIAGFTSIFEQLNPGGPCPPRRELPRRLPRR